MIYSWSQTRHVFSLLKMEIVMLFKWTFLCCLPLSPLGKFRFTKLSSVRALNPLQCLEIQMPLEPGVIIRETVGNVAY